ncbi:MAG: glycosyltransferase family 2 protein [Lachnospiraceae bacterium]|nr:glycosyltransferase family 2 protein [Lachnospiraceae bacterium]
MSLYSVVVPVYNSEHTLEQLYSRLKKVFDEELKRPFELLLIDDSSRDNSWKIMQKLHEEDPRVKIFQMARNFGQHPALLCGFHYVKGDFVITMDDDLQHPPEELPKMIEVMDARDDVDVILAKYENRKHSWIRKLGTRISVDMTTKMLGKDPDLEITSFRLMRRFIVDAIKDTSIHAPQIGNLLVATSNRIINVDVRHDKRAYGHSGYSFKELKRELFYDITTHSDLPLMIVRNIGIVTFLVSFLTGLVLFIRYCLGQITVPGWTSIILVLLIFMGLTLLSIGTLGTYLLNILDESKKRPQYVLRQKEIGEKEDSAVQERKTDA